MESRVTRRVTAVLVAPLAVVPVLALILLAAGLVSGTSGAGFGYAVVLYSTVALMVAYPAIIIIGLPAYFLLLSFGMTSILSHGSTGAVLSVIVSFPTFGLLFGERMFSSSATIILLAFLFALCGATVSVAFRKIAGPPTEIDDIDGHKAA